LPQASRPSDAAAIEYARKVRDELRHDQEPKKPTPTIIVTNARARVVYHFNLQLEGRKIARRGEFADERRARRIVINLAKLPKLVHRRS
jgi:hypothetical protein